MLALAGENRRPSFRVLRSKLTDDTVALHVGVPSEEPIPLVDAFGGDGLETESPGYVLGEVDEDPRMTMMISSST
jgi:hypothetical protein